MTTFAGINDLTGFANGDKFHSEDEVRDYFTVKTMEEVFGNDCNLTTEECNEMAALVLENKWHCEFTEE